MKFTLFLLALFFCLPLQGQQPYIDYLKKSLPGTEGKERIDLLTELAGQLQDSDAKQALLHREEAHKLSVKIGYDEGTRKNGLLLAFAERNKKHYRRSLNITKEYLAACRKLNDQVAELDGLKLWIALCRLIGTRKLRDELEIAQSQLKIVEEQLQLQNKIEVRESELAASQAENEEFSIKIEQVEQDLAQMTREKLEEQNRRITIALEKANLLTEKLTVERDNEALMRQKDQLENEKRLKELEIGKRDRNLVILGLTLIAVLLTSFLLFRYYRLKRLRETERQKSQRQLLMQEKMATLGQLATGIAHEIKNPLNFVNNFAEGSTQLISELEESVAALEGDPSPENKAECQELLIELKENAGDIRRNGNRIDRIVRSMMSHARGGKGEIESTDINQLVKENLNLAYHGFRGLHNSFNMDIKETYDPELKPVEVIPQDMSRVFLNIFGNAIYALNEKREQTPENYLPSLEVKTESGEKNVRISIRDNGPGIPADIRKEVFTPFFTTKPQTKGNTGLGLSLSYDIVVQGHHGKLELESEEGEYTEFNISLPV